MPPECPRCHRTLDFPGELPDSCPACGYLLTPTQPEAGVTSPYAGATLPPLEAGAGADEATPEAVGRYRLLRRLGRGGMGTVYEAVDPSSGQHVALKLMTPEFAFSDEAVERFRREGELASTITHPRCVFVLAADQDHGRPYIVMELMPGATLYDLVQENGPLSVAQAVACILDVIEGLEQAHRAGILHRDVKPSNCFLEPDGHVKVGDFGLARVLAGGEQLTRTGSFVGTPLYASPEQIKKEPLDWRSDIYSVAATLFFLLIGRAPFQGDDELSTMARIVSEPPPSPRGLRPDIPPALDRIILRGLERDRTRRWRTLTELRSALLPFAPNQLTVGGVGLRFLAYALIDDLLVGLCGQLLSVVVAVAVVASLAVMGVSPQQLSPQQLSPLAAACLGLGVLVRMLYFTLLEGIWGVSLGKLWLRLRVCPANSYGPPGIARALRRWLVLYVLTGLPFDVSTILFRVTGQPGLGWVCGIYLAQVGYLLLITSMRQRNGYRGLHELLSGTRVVRLRPPRSPPSPKRRPWKRPTRPAPPPDRPAGVRRRPPPRRAVDALPWEEGLPEQVGPFAVQGTLPWAAPGQVLLAWDASLGREAWVWLRPERLAPLTPARRAVSRATRLRWLAGGRHGEMQWDAFLAPAGGPLPEQVETTGRLRWPEARVLLEQLTAELVSACRDATVPEAVGTDQVWLGPDGEVVLLDFPLRRTAPGQVDGEATRQSAQPAEVVPSDEVGQPSADHGRALALLRRTATLALEGSARPPGEPPSRIRAPVPVHAALLLDRLLGVPRRPRHWLRTELFKGFNTRPAIGHQPYKYPGELQVDLDGTINEPTEVSRPRRVAQILRVDIVLGLGLLLGLGSSGLRHSSIEPIPALILANFGPAFLILWAFLSRGMYLFPWYLYRRRLFLVRASDGRPPSRLQCAWRALLVWAPASGLFSLSAWLGTCFPALHWLAVLAWFLVIPLWIAYGALAVYFPNQAPHDRLAGTCLVPE